MRSVLYAAGVAGIVLLVAFQGLHLWSYDFKVPFTYDGDALINLMYMKSVAQDGWPTTISGLSAPFGYPGAAFPILSSTDWLIIKFMALFTHEPGYLINGFWLLTLVLSAWSAAYAAWQLGLSRTLSFVSGVLYAFLPYALMRNISHINLVYYVVPLLCLLAVLIASGGEGVRRPRQATIVGILACVAQGFDYVYYSFFAVLLFGIAGLLAYRRGERWRLKLPALAIAVITLATTINLFPGIQSWRQDGKPPEMAYKSPAEAEFYGLKIRRLLVPHPANPIRPLGKYAEKDLKAGFPNENENSFARLGMYGALGFVLMVWFTLRRTAGHALSQPASALSALGLATLLITTVGGFGAVINLLTVPDIRAYNRFSVFLAFFCIVIAGLWLSDKFADKSPRWRVIAGFVAGAFIALSLYDQMLDGLPIVHIQQESIRQANVDRAAVRNLERAFPEGAVVLQYPFSGYPIMYPFHKMRSYDHARSYIWSVNSRWSWPSFSQRHRAWQDKMSGLQGEDLVRTAIFSGFNAIWINRDAYEDHGQQLLSGLLVPQVKQIDIGSDQIAVLDLRDKAATLKKSMSEAAFRKQADDALDGTGALITWGDGFYGQEKSQTGKDFRWATKKAEIELRNFARRTASVCASFDIAALGTGTVRIEGAQAPLLIQASAVPQRLHVPLLLHSGETGRLRFSTDMERVPVPQDPRQLYFYVMDFSIKDSGANDGGVAPCDANGR